MSLGIPPIEHSHSEQHQMTTLTQTCVQTRAERHQDSLVDLKLQNQQSRTNNEQKILHSPPQSSVGSHSVGG